jgi:hypothetical protein
MKLVVGMDVGGTKLAVRAETLAGDRVAQAEFDAGDGGWGWVLGVARALRHHLARERPDLDLLILDTEPVAGAVTLTRRLLTTA